jgi:hypothetical protein
MVSVSLASEFTQPLRARAEFTQPLHGKVGFMSVEELKPGMKGIGKTVFSGSEISEFEVEIIGVLKNVHPKGDLILVRLRNELLDKTGLISGMSGSPVYINGKLIGAIAYGWGFTEETIAGVTPIMEMLPLLNEDTQVSGTGWRGKVNLSQPFSFGKYTLREIIVRPYTKPEYSPSIMVLTPIAAPLVVGGFTQDVMNEMEPVFKEFGLLPIQGGGGAEERASADIVPGAVVGAQLLCGDCELTALGTLTYMEDGKILAFGHPFLNAGKVDFPMTGGIIHTIVPSLLFSFKMGSPTTAFGRIHRDTRVAIGGEIGKFPELIPLCIVIKSAGEKKEFNYKMIEDEFWSPTLLDWCVLNSIMSTSSPREKTASSKIRVKLKDYSEPILVENSTVIAEKWLEEITGPFKAMMDNQFQKVDVQHVDLEIELSDTPLSAVIEGIRIDKFEVKPGEDINLTVILKPYGGESTLLRKTITIPEDLPDGELTVIVCDARGSIQMTAATTPGKLKPHSFEQLVELFQEIEKNNEVVVRILTPFSGVTVRGQELPSLPPSLVSIMSSSRETGVESFGGEIFHKILTKWVISGYHQLQVKVKR